MSNGPFEVCWKVMDDSMPSAFEVEISVPVPEEFFNDLCTALVGVFHHRSGGPHQLEDLELFLKDGVLIKHLRFVKLVEIKR